MKLESTKKYKIGKALLLGALAIGVSLGSLATTASAAEKTTTVQAPFQKEELQMTDKWDKVFPEDSRATHHKVTFHNRYGITLAADLYAPKNMKQGDKLPALAVAGPYGAVKEQVSGRYAQEMAARGFLTIAFDPSFTGESAGAPRNTSRRTSIRRIFRRRLITSPTMKMWMRIRSASSAFAAGVGLPSMRRPWIPASKPR